MGTIIEEMIEDSPHMQALREREQETREETVDTVADAIGPSLTFEKSDVEFWVQIAQLCVLILILVQLRQSQRVV